MFSYLVCVCDFTTAQYMISVNLKDNLIMV